MNSVLINVNPELPKIGAKREWVEFEWPIEDRIDFYMHILLSADPDKADNAKSQLIRLGVLH